MGGTRSLHSSLHQFVFQSKKSRRFYHVFCPACPFNYDHTHGSLRRFFPTTQSRRMEGEKETFTELFSLDDPSDLEETCPADEYLQNGRCRSVSLTQTHTPLQSTLPHTNMSLYSREKPRLWQQHEKPAAITPMTELVKLAEPGHETEVRWRIVSSRLKSRYSIDRTWSMVKNF